jgi:hypothetical protein
MMRGQMVGEETGRSLMGTILIGREGGRRKGSKSVTDFESLTSGFTAN